MKIQILSTVAGLALAGCLPVPAPSSRVDALADDSWSSSEWISAVDSPIQEKPGWEGAGHRAADGTAWFVGEVVNEQDVVKAVWMTTALGTYDLYLNGETVGEEDVLKPGFTSVFKTRRSFTYDVTGSVLRGKGAKNVLAAEVSAGWWRDKIVNFHGKKSAFRGVLELTYADGTVRRYGTDLKNWKAKGVAGPVTHAAIFDGEEYDARIARPYFGGEGFRAPERNTEFKGAILPNNGAEICCRFDLAMVRGPYSLKKGEKLVIDFGQNAAAVPRFVFSAKAGTRLTFLPGEMLNDAEKGVRGCDGPKGSVYRANLRSADVGMWAKYVFAGEGVETYVPRFSFFGYRYAELSADGDVEIRSVASVPVTSITKEMEIGSIETGHAVLNRFIANVYWGQLSNYLSVPTDCPQRNERLGWMADTQVFVDAGAYNADTRRFFHKWMQDVVDTQSDKGGFPGVSPWAQYGANATDMMRVGWADAGVIVPWKVWRQFGDREVVDQCWSALEKYVDHVNATKYDFEAIKGECGSYQWNDWLSLDRFESCSSGLNSEFDAFTTVDGKRVTRQGVTDYWSFMGACYWAIDAQMMAEMAAGTGRDGAKWAKMAADAKAYLRGKYFKTTDGTIIPLFAAMQTPAVFALKLGLVEGAAKEKTIAFLKGDLAKRGNVTGFLGSSWLMDVLVENGMPDLAVDRMLSRTFPSWLYSVDQGATTIWERWNGWTIEKGFGPVGMNSYNHYAYGAVLGWIYRSLAGIAPDSSAPGFRKIVMKPIFDKRLGYVKAAYDSAAGRITSHWRYEGDKVLWDFTVPAGATALVTLPGETAAKTYTAGTYHLER